jgi:hypothetical protein
MSKLSILFCLLFSAGEVAQAQSSTRVAPDCAIAFSFTAAARVPAAGFPNGSAAEPGCVTWTLVYYSTGFSALSLRLDSAPDSTGVAGTWVTFAGTLLSGINPNTATTQAFTTIFGYNPWVSVNLTSKTGTGTIRGVAYGWKVPSQVFATTTSGGASQDVNLIKVGGAAIALGQALMAASLPVVLASNQSALSTNDTIVGPLGQAVMSSSVPVAIASNQSAVPVSLAANQSVNVAQINAHTTLEGGVNGGQGVGGLGAAAAATAGNPVLVGGSNGTNTYNVKIDSQGNGYNFLGCTLTAEVALSGTGYTEIVVGTAAQVIQICKVFVTSAAAGSPVVNTFSIVSATIATCAGTTELVSANSVTGIDLDWGGALRSGSGKSICVSESTANSDKVTISYSKF